MTFAIVVSGEIFMGEVNRLSFDDLAARVSVNGTDSHLEESATS